MRSTHHATATPITAQRTVTATASRTVFQISVTRQVPEEQRLERRPADVRRLQQQEDSGSSTAATTTVPAPSRLGGAGRRRRRDQRRAPE